MGMDKLTACSLAFEHTYIFQLGRHTPRNAVNPTKSRQLDTIRVVQMVTQICFPSLCYSRTVVLGSA